MTSRNEVYKLIDRALSDKLADKLAGKDDVEIGQDDTRMFLRVNNQVFAITVEERTQFNQLEPDRATAAAKEFMATLPYPSQS